MASELSALDLLNYESIYSNEYERILDDSSSIVSNLKDSKQCVKTTSSFTPETSEFNKE